MLTRRQVFGTLPLFPLRADEAAEVRDLLARMAGALGDASAAEFLRCFDRQMSGYARLERQVYALLNQFAVASSVEVLEQRGDQRQRNLEADWLLEMRSLAATGPLERRRGILKLTLERRGRDWRIRALDPPDFFEPPRGR
ncbi:MAG: hypothetical protein FJW34_05315 [Acidobacteria bacterium]|nr:hypothetical protein [Acidobacteriota bacterium]